MQRPGIELEADNGEDDNRKKHQEADLQQWRHRLDYGLQDHLQAYITKSFITSGEETWNIFDSDYK